MTADQPRVGDTITTADQLDALLEYSTSRGEYVIVTEGWRPWILTDNEHGDVWAHSWLEEGEERPVKPLESLRLPLTVLYVPGEPSTPPAAIDAAHLTRQREWSRRTFGPHQRVAGVLDHIRKELREIEADPTDVSEWADVLILGFDGAWRAGHEPQAIIDAIIAKQARNEARTWPDWRTADPDKAIEHVRSGEPSAPDNRFAAVDAAANEDFGIEEDTHTDVTEQAVANAAAALCNGSTAHLSRWPLVAESAFCGECYATAQRLAAAGLLATAPTTTEWGVQVPWEDPDPMPSEDAAHAAQIEEPRLAVVRREVTAWTEAGR